MLLSLRYILALMVLISNISGGEASVLRENVYEDHKGFLHLPLEEILEDVLGGEIHTKMTK